MQVEYHGNVKVTVGKSSRIRKNNGLPQLFEIICRFLAQQYNSNNVNDLRIFPQKIDLKKKLINEEYTSVLYSPVDITQEFIFTEIPTVRFTGNITYSNLSADWDNAEDYKVFLLDGESPTNTLAYSTVDPNMIKKITSGRSALIEWSLSFKNPEDEGDNK